MPASEDCLRKPSDFCLPGSPSDYFCVPVFTANNQPLQSYFHTLNAIKPC